MTGAVRRAAMSSEKRKNSNDSRLTLLIERLNSLLASSYFFVY